MDKLRCPQCNATTDAQCSCGVAYEYIPAGKLAAEAVAKPDNADKSDPKLAEELGVGKDTIRRARKAAGCANAQPEQRTGKDGKKQASKKASREEEEIQAQRLARVQEIAEDLVREGSIKKKGDRYFPRHKCSFCKKDEESVAHIFVSPYRLDDPPYWPCICNECVERCTKMIAEKTPSDEREIQLKAEEDTATQSMAVH